MRALFLLVALAGCGEIERADLAVRPRQDDFAEEIQPLLLSLGCSPAGGCHDIGQGDVTIKVATDGAALEASYLSVKARIDREDPAQSRILQSVLAENTASQHFPPGCIRQDGCAWQKLVAWIAWDADADPRPQDVACDPAPEGCFK
ncbi:MAG: hypothetical protein H6706_12285 [Myxococcales bacterium]|nr:hypothetical protein [Myxococcales bacterium]